MEKLNKIEMRDLKALVQQFGGSVNRRGVYEQGDQTECKLKGEKAALACGRYG